MSDSEKKDSNKTTFDELLSPLDEALEKIESQRKVHHREVLSFTGFVHLLIYYFISAPKSGRQLITDIITASKSLNLGEVKRATFFDAFNRFPVSWFATLFTAVLTSITWQSIPELDLLGKLYLVDGSIFPALTKMFWAEYKKDNPAIKLHLCFELNRMVPLMFVIGKGKSSEIDALRQMLQAGATYIADRGYVSFALLKDIRNAYAHFVIRMKGNLVYKTTEVLSLKLPSEVAHIFTGVSDKLVELTNATGTPIYRLVTFKVGKVDYLILTSRLDLSTFEIILLYAYRWQVELAFRFLKRTLNGLHLLSTTSEGINIQFYVLLIAALLQLRLKQECVRQQEILEMPSNHNEPKTEKIPGLMVPIDNMLSARGQTFLATVGEKLHRYWKISIHWVITLRNLLAHPFNQRAQFLLASM